MHLSIAEEVITRLRHTVMERNRGSYYLGCTAPDIRFFIGASREDTHFLSLDSEEGESGVMPMFEAYPDLARAADLNDATRAFIAGYLSHLVTDESWIYCIYRPYFGESSPLAGDPMANLMDRVLQFELDRRERINNCSISRINEHLIGSDTGVEVRFIENRYLTRWLEFVHMATTRKPNWEDFRYFAQRYLSWIRQIAPDELETFFTSFDTSLEQVMSIVPEEKVQSFRERSIADSISAARGYLG